MKVEKFEVIQITIKCDEAKNIVQEIKEISNSEWDDEEFMERYSLLTKLRLNLTDELLNL